MHQAETIFWQVIGKTVELVIESFFEAVCEILLSSHYNIDCCNSPDGFEQLPSHFKRDEHVCGPHVSFKGYNLSDGNIGGPYGLYNGEPFNIGSESTYEYDHSDSFGCIDPLQSPEAPDPSYTVIYDEQLYEEQLQDGFGTAPGRLYEEQFQDAFDFIREDLAIEELKDLVQTNADLDY